MKNWMIWLPLFLVLNTSLQAQTDKRAKAILDAVGQKYRALKTYQANFTATGSDTYTGTLTASGTKFRLQMGDQDIYVDDNTTSTYVKETNELTIQKSDASTGTALNPAQFYTLYQQGYTYRFLKEHKVGNRTVEVVELTATKPKSDIKSIQLSVDKADRSIRGWVLTSANGQSTRYTLTQFTPNAKLAPNFFTFDKSRHPGVEVVDLR